MNKLILTIALFVTSSILKANDNECFIQAMRQTLMELGKAKDVQDEVEVLKAQNYMMRISVDGQARWMKFGSAFEGVIAKAKEINSENPRAYMSKAQMVYFTPAQFGRGPEKACPEVQEANAKFTNFKPISPIAPTWGAEQMKGMVCK